MAAGSGTNDAQWHHAEFDGLVVLLTEVRDELTETRKVIDTARATDGNEALLRAVYDIHEMLLPPPLAPRHRWRRLAEGIGLLLLAYTVGVGSGWMLHTGPHAVPGVPRTTRSAQKVSVRK